MKKIEYIYFFVIKVFKFLCEITIPSVCAKCKEFIEGHGICLECWKKIKWITGAKCNVCGRPIEIDENLLCAKCIKKRPFYDKVISAFEYDDFSKDLIIRFKHYDGTFLKQHFISWMLRAFYLNMDGISNQQIKIDVIVPVPIHFSKRLVRFYNQSELLANGIAKAINTKYEPRVLMKNKNTKPQEGLTARSRKSNLKGSFGINENYLFTIEKKNILLIDDVFTTGSTVNECAKILKKHGAQTVVVLTLARVI